MLDEATKFAPSQEQVQEAMIKGLEGRVDRAEINNFVATATSASAPAPIAATAGLKFFAIYGVVYCDPRPAPENKWTFDADVWGIGAGAFDSLGFMYTAYNSFDALFANTTAFHAQAGAVTGGILQINWFNKSGVPVGQFNGAAAGIGVLEAGGGAKWKKK